MSQKLNKDKIIIIDFGSQVTKLIARRIREFNVYSEILTSNEIKKLDKIIPLILLKLSNFFNSFEVKISE